MTMIRNVSFSTAATGAQATQAVNVTPFHGNLILLFRAATPAATVVTVQTAPREDSATWETLKSFAAASIGQHEITGLKNWMRFNVTTAAAGNFVADLEGVQ